MMDNKSKNGTCDGSVEGIELCPEGDESPADFHARIERIQMSTLEIESTRQFNIIRFGCSRQVGLTKESDKKIP